jgi:hypothetical protein
MALDTFQQVFCLSMEICSASGAPGTVESLEAQLTTNFAKLFDNTNFAPGWELVWGPVVFQSPYSDLVDQATAVCYNAAAGYYVVPIAATSPVSPFMVLIEDGAILPPQYMRPNPIAGAGKLSYGNYVALQVLLNLTSNGQTLGQYLSGVASSSNNLVICGHSLGGGLTPLLAYALYPLGTKTKNSGWQNVYTYPTAGPSTADATFQTAFNSAYPVVQGSGYAMWNANQYNGRDIVPCAWSISTDGPNLNQITWSYTDWDNSDMFKTGLVVGGEISALQLIAINFAAGVNGSNPYVQTNNNLLWTEAQQTVPLNSNDDLVTEILYQHITAYTDQFGVSSLFPPSVMMQRIGPPLLPLVRGVAGTGAKLLALQSEIAAGQGRA